MSIHVEILRASILALLLCLPPLAHSQNRLAQNFYQSRCPSAERVVRDVVAREVQRSPGAGAQLIRLIFHDCFARGCDASVLLNSTRRQRAERDADPNITLGGFQIVDEIKRALEATCPNTVSCADIVAMAGRDAVQALGGPFINIRTGRRDGTISIDQDANELPSARLGEVSQIMTQFTRVGMDLTDMVALTGAHSVGRGLCSRVEGRFAPPDRRITPQFRQQLGRRCGGRSFDKNRFLMLDHETPNVFDNQYYKNLLKREGVFSSDSALTVDPAARRIVQRFAGNQAAFFDQFSRSFIKMSEIEVLSGKRGQIRKVCSVINRRSA